MTCTLQFVALRLYHTRVYHRIDAYLTTTNRKVDDGKDPLHFVNEVDDQSSNFPDRYVYAYVCVYIYVYIYIYIYIYMCVCVYIYMYIFI